MAELSDKRWLIAEKAPPKFLTSFPSVSPLVMQLLYNRGLITPGNVTAFLRREGPISDPFAMVGMEDAVALIQWTIEHKYPIVVYGDYDVDGVTATAVLLQTLQVLGARVAPYIPDREEEGYGLNPRAIRALAARGTKLLITVDCGVRSVAEVFLARQLGMRVIITDHHHLGSVLPSADVILNPRRPENAGAFDGLAGVGVAFKLAQALLRSNQESPLPTVVGSITSGALLDLVALGTVADMVTLKGENRALVSQGLEQINAGRRAGLAALMRVAEVEPGRVTSETIGFALAPRLNAAGRIDKAELALQLLVASDMGAALQLARRLDELNGERRKLTQEVREKVLGMVAARDSIPTLIFAGSPDFAPGVVGLAASRLVDEFYRPAVVVATGNKYSKGSARSIPEFHITRALDAVADLLERHGGHAAAAGFTVLTSRLEELAARLEALAEEELVDDDLVPTLRVDAEVTLQELSWDLYNQLERLRPYGDGNPEPLFVTRSVRVVSARAVGMNGKHLKLRVVDGLGREWDAIAFRQGHWMGHLPQYVDLAYKLTKNVWHERVSLQLNVQDIRPAG